MTEICTLEQVKAVTGDADCTRDDLINRLIHAATGFIERRTRRSLTLATATRYFDGTDKGYLIVDDFQSVSAVSLLNPDNTAWRTFTVATELRCEPYNQVPKYKLLIVNTVTENPYRVIGASPYIFPRGIANVSVTAVWGSYASVPPELEDLGINLVVSKLNRLSTRGIRSASIGGESVSFTEADLDPGMKADLSDFKRQYAELWP